MTAFDLHIVFDCAEPERVAQFWKAALGGYDFPTPVPDSFFLQVPEAKLFKNRLHLDIKVAPGLSGADRRTAVDAEVDRLIELGAGVVRRTEEPDGYFVVMQDPEANEFCVA